MQTTHSEMLGPSTGLGAEGVTGVPGVTGELGAWKTMALGSNDGVKGGDAMGIDTASSFFWDAAAESEKDGQSSPLIYAEMHWLQYVIK